MIHIRVLLVLTALAFICHAQRNQAGQQCLCGSFRDRVDARSNISDIQIYPITDFCSQIEIIVTNKQGGRYCLNPQNRAVIRLVTKLLQKKKQTLSS